MPHLWKVEWFEEGDGEVRVTWYATKAEALRGLSGVREMLLHPPMPCPLNTLESDWLEAMDGNGEPTEAQKAEAQRATLEKVFVPTKRSDLASFLRKNTSRR